MTLRMTEEEYAALMKRRRNEPHPSGLAASHLPPEGKAFGEADNGEGRARRSKYGNRRVEIDGMKFDSRHEADVYQALMLRVKAGELRCVLRQTPFDLPGGIRYMADFVTIDREMRIEGVYDAKSEITKKNRTYINKKKQMKACWGIEIREV